MVKHNDIGKQGEELAVEFLKKKGFTILHRNWKWGKNEIDIIALDDEELLHFVEVKCRKGNDCPEQSVTKKKFSIICRVADAFLYYNKKYKKIQFDIVAINLLEEPEYFFIKDIYL